MKNERTLKGIAYAIVGFFLFSVGDVIAKHLRSWGYGPFQISFSYAVVAVLVLLAFSGLCGGLTPTLKTTKKKWHALRALLAAPTQALVFYALSKMPLSNAYAVIFLAPFLTAVLAVPLLKERVTKAHWLVILIGFVGVLIAMRPDLYGFSAPVLAVLIVAFCTAGRNVIVGKMGSQETPLSLALYPSVGVLFAMLIPAWRTSAPLTPLVTLLLAIGGATFGAGLLLTSLSFRYAPIAVAAPFHYTQIIWGILAGALFFGGAPDVWTLIGCAIIIVSGVFLVRLRNALPGNAFKRSSSEPALPAT